MAEVLSNPVFGIALSVMAYAVGVWLNKKLKTPLANPLLIAVVLLIAFFLLTGIPMEYYDEGGDIINFLIFPATASIGQLLTALKITPAAESSFRTASAARSISFGSASVSSTGRRSASQTCFGKP